MLITASLIVITLLATLGLALWWRHECHQQSARVRPHVLWFSALLGLIAVMLFLSVGIQPGTLQLLQDNRQFKPEAKQLIAGTPLDQLENKKVPLLGLIHALQSRLVHHPSAAGWASLSRLYMELAERSGYDTGGLVVEAAEHAIALAPDEQTYQLLLAQAVIMANDGKLNERSWALLDAFVKAHPEHDGAWLMFAMSAVKAKRYDVAEYAFGVLLQRHNDDRVTELLQKSLTKVKEDKKRADYFAEVSVEVQREADSQLRTGGTLFVFIKEKGGSGQPLAAKRILLDHFPQHVTLTTDNWLQDFPATDSALQVGVRYASGADADVAASGQAVEVPLERHNGRLSVQLTLK